MTQASFTRLDDNRWGLRFSATSGNPIVPARGEEVLVARRNGESTRVRVGARLDSWNGGRVVVTSIDRNDARPTAPTARQVGGTRVPVAPIIVDTFLPALEAARALVNDCAAMDDELATPELVAELRAALEAVGA